MSEWVDRRLEGWMYNRVSTDAKRTTCPERSYVPGDKTALSFTNFYFGFSH